MAELKRLVEAEELSFAASESLQPVSGPFDSVFRLSIDGRHVYALRCRTRVGTSMMLMTEPALAQLFSPYSAAFKNAGVAYRILDAGGETVAGASGSNDKPFLVTSLPGSFPGWNVELFVGGGDVFERRARRQITVYIWTGALVILLFLAAASLATLAVSRQIRLNRMKNDFIATVSHELKTPLASMRVLMDTLLEGNIRDEAQAKQYLRLAAKENERLSRMIDNFLTFSRMERNKQAFVMADADPTAIAMDAVDSIHTKYAAHHCHLSVETARDLPRVNGDHDALVTVLVNLLDNACKYTGPDKRIGLKVYPERDAICFAVSDNGIGLSRRHLRRIFDRFYQVDSSLARKAEGSGLGLSIVKFIVDAHKGSVTVESKPGKGSVFYVRLPAGHPNGHLTTVE
jgi:signal transduction histidine kinase